MALSSEKRTRILLVAFVAIVAVLYGATLNNRIPIDYDNGIYAVLGKALAEGEGYALTHYPRPVPHTLHPFLFPVILAGIHKMAGINFLAFKIVPALCGVATLIFFILLFKDRIPTPFFASVVLLCGINPHFTNYSHQILSDTSFIAAAFASFIFVEKYKSDEKIFSLNLLLSIALITCAFYFRIVGVLLLASAVLYIFLEKRDARSFVKSVLLFGAGAILMSLFFLRNKFLVGGSGNERVFFLKDAFNPEAGIIGFADLTARFTNNFITHLKNFSLWVAGNDLFTHNAGYIVIAAFIALGLVFYLIRNRKSSEYFFVLYLIAISFWVNSDKRYILPLLPFCLLYLFKGFHMLSEFLVRNIGRPSIRLLMIILSVLILLAGLIHKSMNPELFDYYSIKYFIFFIVFAATLVFFNLAAHLKKIRVVRLCLLSALVGVLLVSNGVLATEYARLSHSDDFYDDAKKEYVKAAEWIKENTEENALVLCDTPPVMHLLSSRKTYHVPLTYDTEKIKWVIKEEGVDYIFVDSLPPPTVTRRFLLPFIEKESDNLLLIHSLGESKIFRVEKY